MKNKIIIVALLMSFFSSCDKKRDEDFLTSLDNTLWRHSPATSIPLNGGSILFVDDYLVPSVYDAVTC